MYPHQLEEGGNLWGTLPRKFPNYTHALEEMGYLAGYAKGPETKGWGPGDYTVGGYTRNPAGHSYTSFKAFVDSLPQDKPFVFWLGDTDPHRPYYSDSTAARKFRVDQIKVPGFLPNDPVVRQDIADYYFEVERFDHEAGEALQLLKKHGLLKHTLVVMTSDNGMPFPRAKATLYDGGTRVPLVIWNPEIVVKGNATRVHFTFSRSGNLVYEFTQHDSASTLEGASQVEHRLRSLV